ncbi:MAG: transcriptional regulator [Burkholderiales bacterium]|nr:transcriptional regulator [Burkholderiales bacterium]
MKTVTIRIERDTGKALRQMGERFVRAWNSGGRAGGSFLTFESPAALFRVLTPTRWALIERLQALGPTSQRALARALERDVKRVHGDVQALIELGLVDRTEAGQVRVPYEVIRADFDLRAARIQPPPRAEEAASAT